MKRSLLTIAVAAIAALICYSFYGSIGLLPLAITPFAFGISYTSDDVVRYLIAIGLLDAAGGYKKTIKAKTADYVIATGTDASGTVFTNRGAGAAVVFTLPAPARALAGVFYEFLIHADFAVSVQTATADTLIGLHDVDLDKLGLATASEMIGGHFRAICDGTSWFAYCDSVGHTVTRTD